MPEMIWPILGICFLIFCAWLGQKFFAAVKQWDREIAKMTEQEAQKRKHGQ